MNTDNTDQATTILVRPAHPGDLAALVNIQRTAWLAAFGPTMPAEYLAPRIDEQAITAEWQARLAQTPANSHSADQVLVAERAGTLLGYVEGGMAKTDEPPLPTPTATAAELRRLYLSPDAWGSGVAVALHDALLSALAPHADIAVLWVGTTNARARRFYERNGWITNGVGNTWTAHGMTMGNVRYTHPLRTP